VYPNGSCVVCLAVTTSEWVTKNRDKVSANSSKSQRKWRRENPEEAAKKSRERSRKWSRENPERRRVIWQRWAQNNPDKINANAARRRARKLNAIPPDADHDMIDAIYALARAVTEETGEQWTVEHHIPLALGGLHCPSNLTLLPLSDNCSKGWKMPTGPCPTLQETLDRLPYDVSHLLIDWGLED
jgi:hypothetical protein